MFIPAVQGHLYFYKIEDNGPSNRIQTGNVKNPGPAFLRNKVDHFRILGLFRIDQYLKQIANPSPDNKDKINIFPTRSEYLE